MGARTRAGERAGRARCVVTAHGLPPGAIVSRDRTLVSFGQPPPVAIVLGRATPQYAQDAFQLALPLSVAGRERIWLCCDRQRSMMSTPIRVFKVSGVARCNFCAPQGISQIYLTRPAKGRLCENVCRLSNFRTSSILIKPACGEANLALPYRNRGATVAVKF